MKLAWSPQQECAIRDARNWLKDPHAPQILRLFGFAGTGKTTLAQELARLVKGKVLFATFTGKAALVLQSKGCEDARTIHSLIYTSERDQVTGEMMFTLNEMSDLADAALLIVDEVSMVGEELARDLLSFGVRILVLGDPAQLPPVKDAGFFINAEPDIMLTEVHRQAADNPIIRMSMDIREGRRLQPGTYGDSVVIDRRRADRRESWRAVTNTEQLICGRNATRQTANWRIRRDSGLAVRDAENEWLPVTGDRLICLNNQRERGLLNGMMFDVLESEIAQHQLLLGAKMRIQSLDSPQRPPLDVNTPREFFFGTEKELSWRDIMDHEQFTFGWAITCHKAQGSQWQSVGIIDESHVFREDRQKWLYTAVTRAAERVTVVV